MAHCDEYIELISAAIDGALSPAERERLEEHLASCPECKALYEDLAAVHTALGDLSPVEVPADLTERIMAAVAGSQVVHFEKKKAPIRWQRWLASAAVLAVVVAGTWSWKPWETTAGNGKPKSAEPQQATVGMAAPEAAQAAPEGVAETAELFSDDAEPAAGAYTVNGGDAAAKVSVEAASAEDTPAEGPEETGLMAPRMFRMTPAPESDRGDGEESALPTEAPEGTDSEVAPIMMANSLPIEEAGTAEMTAREALDVLLETYPMPKNAVLMDTEDFLGWQTPYSVYSDQQISTQLCYWRLTPNGKYHEFRVYSCIFDSYLSDEPHTSTLNFYAVPLEGGNILMQRHAYEGGLGSPGWEAYQAGIDAYHDAICN